MEYLIGDLHFEDPVVTKYRGMSVREHDNLLIRNWNDIVTSNDTVIITGDISATLADQYKVRRKLERLNGDIVIILGNHDHIQDYVGLYETYHEMRVNNEFGTFLITHHPIIFGPFGDKSVINIHSHIHDTMKIEDGHHICTSAEVLDYIPRTFEYLVNNKLK